MYVHQQIITNYSFTLCIQVGLFLNISMHSAVRSCHYQPVYCSLSLNCDDPQYHLKSEGKLIIFNVAICNQMVT